MYVHTRMHTHIHKLTQTKICLFLGGEVVGLQKQANDRVHIIHTSNTHNMYANKHAHNRSC